MGLVLFAIAPMLTLALPVQDVTAEVPEAWTRDIAMLPDGNLLVARSDGSILVFDGDTGQPSMRGAVGLGRPRPDVFASHPWGVDRIAVDPRGERVAAVSKVGRIVLWNTKVQPDGRLGYPGLLGRPEVILTPGPGT